MEVTGVNSATELYTENYRENVMTMVHCFFATYQSAIVKQCKKK